MLGTGVKLVATNPFNLVAAAINFSGLYPLDSVECQNDPVRCQVRHVSTKMR